ncbi:MAG: flagellar basal-body MS-ring/collar protein FliF, partial [Anaplasmataceae bacterium]|nr:flagellar basal-body MS-ring/collar protein FliF [Anaplasmataceae bacterium]
MLAYLKQFDNKKIALAVTSLLFVLIMIIVFFQFNSDRYVPIYKNINESDKINIVKYFHQWGINYIETSDDITVLEQDARSLRVKLAYEGIPAHNSSIGYEIFDSEETLGSSSFSQNINMLRSLEGELSRSLSSFENIKSARVHLVLPKREIFTLKNDVQASSASIILSLYDNNNISQKQIKAMLHLISSSVPKLSTKNITIVSTSGKTFYLAADVNDNEEESLDQSSDFDYKKETESKLTNRAQKLLEMSFGNNRVKVEVVADIDTDREIIDSETFNP